MKQTFTILTLLLISCFTLNAQSTDKVSVQKNVTLVQFSTGYTAPLDIQNCGDNRLFIAQRPGVVSICDSLGEKRNQPYLNIKKRVDSHKGLLGFCFDPDYATNGY